MRLYKMIINKVPADSQKWYMFYGDEDPVLVHDPAWQPEGWTEHVDLVASYGDAWAKRCQDEGYPFFWPAHDKVFLSRSTAEEKRKIAERWGAEAVVVEAEVGPFIPVAEANRIRKARRDQVRVEKLRAKIREIEGVPDDLPF